MRKLVWVLIVGLVAVVTVYAQTPELEKGTPDLEKSIIGTWECTDLWFPTHHAGARKVVATYHPNNQTTSVIITQDGKRVKEPTDKYYIEGNRIWFTTDPSPNEVFIFQIKNNKLLLTNIEEVGTLMFHRVLTPTETGKTQEEKDTIKDDLDEDEKEDRLIKQLDDSNPEHRRRAFWRLLELLNDEEDRVYQRKMLKDNNPEIRARAILSLGWVEGKEVMAEIIKKLDDDNEIVRSATLRMIVDRWMSELDTTGYMPAIISKLNDTSSYIRSRAIGSLYELEVKEAIPDIKKRLKDNEKYIRMTARKVLEEWGVEIPEEENKDK